MSANKLKEQLNNVTVKELRSLLKGTGLFSDAHVKGTSALKKKELIAHILKHVQNKGQLSDMIHDKAKLEREEEKHSKPRKSPKKKVVKEENVERWDPTEYEAYHKARYQAGADWIHKNKAEKVRLEMLENPDYDEEADWEPEDYQGYLNAEYNGGFEWEEKNRPKPSKSPKKKTKTTTSMTKRKSSTKKKMTKRKSSTKKKEDGGCVEVFTKKYQTRPSPPFAANTCPDAKRKGNDGNEWVSKSNVHGVYTWRKA